MFGLVTKVLGWVGGPSILPWVLLGLVTAGGVFGTVMYSKGRASALAESREAMLETQILSLKRDLEIQRNATAQAQADQEAITTRATAAQEIIREYQQSVLAGRDACAVDDDLLRRMRELEVSPGPGRPTDPR